MEPEMQETQGQPNEIWVAMLKEVNEKIRAAIRSVDRDKAETWPRDIAQLKRPHFIDMQVYMEAFRSQNPKKMIVVPGVETIERCFRYPEKNREKATRDSLAVFAGFNSYDAYRRRYLENRPLKIQLSLAQSRVHMEFQGRIRELQKNIPHTMSSRDFETDDEMVLRYITLYFFLVFDEFHICRIISPDELGVLWDEFYAKGVAHALERPAFRLRLLEMLKEEDDYAFFGLKKEFQEEIMRIYRETYGKELAP